MSWIFYNPQQENKTHRYEVHCDAGIFGFRTYDLALAFQRELEGAAA